MSIAALKIALESAIKTNLGTFPIAWENMSFIPPTDGGAFASVFILPATPANPTFGSSFHREVGLIQVTLNYPIDGGSGKVYVKAETVRDSFKRGTTFTSGGITVHVQGTPAIGPGIVQGNRYTLPIRINYFANVEE